MPVKRFVQRHWHFLLCAGLLLWLDVYLCRELFSVEYTAHMNSMHGFWIGMARMTQGEWWTGGWWPYWYGGLAFDLTYAPLFPGLVAAWANLTGLSHAAAFLRVTGFVICLGPLATFVLAAGLTRSPMQAVTAGILAALTTLSAVVAPDWNMGGANPLYPRKLSLMLTWDDAPHMLALGLLPLFLLFAFRSLEDRKALDQLLAILLAVLCALASMFGVVLLAASSICLLLARGGAKAGRDLYIVARIGFVSYLIVCPFVSPSLIATIRANGKLNGESGPWTGSLLALAMVILALVALQWIWRKWPASVEIKLAGYLAAMLVAIPALDQHLGKHFLPQPGRYRMDADWALAFLMGMLLVAFLKRFPLTVRAAGFFVLAAIAAETVVTHRRSVKWVLRERPIEATVEYRVAKWLERNAGQERVLLPGSISIWANAFVSLDQFSGGSYTTLPNPVAEIARWQIIKYGDFAEQSQEATRLWLQAYGVSILGVSGPKSPEYWKPYGRPERFAGKYPVLWSSDDTYLYRIPLRSASLAHVVSSDALVRKVPRSGDDTGEVRRYVSELQDPSRPVAQWRWTTRSAGRAKVTTGADDVVSLQINHLPGWSARVDGEPAEVKKDGLGQMYVPVRKAGSHEIELQYWGGFASVACRGLSYSTLIGLAVWIIRHRKEITA